MFNFLKRFKRNNRFADKNADNNIILTDNVQLSLDTVQTGKNLNVCVIGGAGTGKTYNYVLPNILQANTSYVITDHGGYLLNKTGEFLKEQGYIIKVLNLSDTEHSNHYNPFNYVYDKNGICNEAAVTIMVEQLLEMFDLDGNENNYEDRAAFHLVYTICLYLIENENKENQNLKSVFKLLNIPVAEQGKPFYTCYGKNAEAIRIAALVKLQAFYMPDILNITNYDDMELNLIGDRKTAVFITLPTFNHSLNALSSVLVTQIFNALYSITESLPNNKLPVHVRFMLDDFYISGYIPDFEKHSAVCRHHNISVNVILQDIVHLKMLYSNWEIILNNCDSILFLGSRSCGNLKYLPEFIGVDADKMFALNAYECVLNIRGLPSIYGRKFDPEKHINYGKIKKE